MIAGFDIGGTNIKGILIDKSGKILSFKEIPTPKIAKDIGWKYHSTIIWNEGNISRRTAWGSFMSASAPYVIAPVELILVLYKHVFNVYLKILFVPS
jgi:hypothetical protein